LGHNVSQPGLFVKAHPDDAGFDMVLERTIILTPRKKRLVELAFGLVIPSGYYGQIKCKSGLALKKGLLVFEGVIDSGYRGWIKICIRNENFCDITLERGTKIAQMLILPVPNVRISPVMIKNVEKTERGDGGFGSTGFIVPVGAPVGAGGSGDCCFVKDYKDGEESLSVTPDTSLTWVDGMTAQYSWQLRCMVGRNGLPFVESSGPPRRRFVPDNI